MKLLAGILGGSVGCGDPASGTASSAGGSAASGFSTSDAGPGSVVVSSAATGSSSASGAGGADPGWTHVAWARADCQLDAAANPAAALPPLEWSNCPQNRSGCEMVTKNWPQPDYPQSAVLSQVLRVDEGYLLSLFVGVPGEHRSTIVGSDGVVLTAYRNPDGQACFPTHLLPAVDGHWFGTHEVGTPSTYVFQPSGQTTNAAELTPVTPISPVQTGTQALLALQLDLSAGVHVFDRSTGKTQTSPPGMNTSELWFTHGAGDVGFLRATAKYQRPEGWVWTREGGFARVLDTGDEVVIDVRGDGEWLVWIQAPPPLGDGRWLPGTLYRSPFTASYTDVAPAPVRTVPSRSPTKGVLGSGRYAFYSSSEQMLYIVRLEDARSWSFAVPVDEWRAPLANLVYLDAQYLFFATTTQIYRQRLDALGPGAPPPE
jgi:hypothetical protein